MQERPEPAIAGIRLSTRIGAPPAWAVLQRRVFEELDAAIDEYVDRYTRDDGSLIWRDRWPGMDGSDDPYEAFMYLALLYALGGGEKAYRAARRMWDAITWQWTQYGQIEREFDGYYDWMHHGEANLFHYFFGLTKPDSLVDRQRADRFARMYTGEDPLAPNFDRRLGIIRAAQTGSRGPRFTLTAEDLSTHRGVLDDYLPPFEDLTGVPFPSSTCDWSDDTVYAEIIEKMNRRTTRGDVPLNLNATGQLTHAYLYSGRSEYREWVVDYLAGWAARADRNGGILPDNVGLSGRVGEYLDGKWWGGHYGWRWPHGLLTIIEPAVIAGLNAYLLTGDQDQLRLARQQLDVNFAMARTDGERLVVPHKHFDSGWSDYRPPSPLHPVHIWARTLAEEDLERVERIPEEGDRSAPEVPRVPFTSKHYNVNTLAWYHFIRGRNPDFPERALEANLELIEQQLRRMRSPAGDPANWERLETIDGHDVAKRMRTDGYAIHAWQEFSPIYFESLIQLTLGAPAHLSHGGLQHSTLRYYDAALRRPGLPQGVSALVREIRSDGVELELVNLGSDARRVIVQAGAFREHRFGAAARLEGGRVGDPVAVDGEWLEIRLEGRSGGTVSIAMDRYVNDPSYETPWSRRTDWAPLIRPRRPLDTEERS